MSYKQKNIIGALTVALVSMATLLSPSANARKHIVLFEKFTNVGCQPCAVFAPMADSLLDARLGDVVEIAYHGNTPYPNDEFYLPVRDQVEKRISYYNVYAYPTVKLDGSEASLSIDEIGNRLDFAREKKSSLDIRLSSSIENGRVRVNVTLLPGNDTRYSNARLFVAALEAEIRPEKPAFNGQTEFHNEFRQFLTSPDGDPVTLGSGPLEWDGEWTIERMENEEELAIVAWVQDMSTKRVIETAYIPRAPKTQTDARIVRLADLPKEICDPLFSGRFWLRNQGADALTHCEIAIDIDGESHTFPWEGNLPYLATEEVIIPPFSDFDYDPDKTVSAIVITPTNLNGSDTEGEGKTGSLYHSPAGEARFKLLLSTDNKPEEISWRMVNSRGEQICESEPYTERRHNYYIELPITEDGCYTIEFLDAGGNGISGTYGNGFYRLYDWRNGDYRELIQSTYKGANHKLLFRAVNVGSNSIISAADTSDDIIVWDSPRRLIFPTGGRVTLYDSEGRQLLLRDMSEGEALSLEDIDPGIYVVNCNSGEISRSITIRL